MANGSGTSVLRYARLLLKRSFLSWQGADALGSLIQLAWAGLIAFLAYGGFELTMNVPMWPFLLLWFFVLVFVVTPYRLSREEAGVAHRLRQQQSSSLEIEGPVVVESPESGGFNTIAYLTVKNTGGQMLEQCLVKIGRVTADQATARKIGAPIALRTEQQTIGKRSGRFKLSPGEEKKLRIASHVGGRSDTRITFHLESKEPMVTSGPDGIGLEIVALSELSTVQRLKTVLRVNADRLTCSASQQPAVRDHSRIS